MSTCSFAVGTVVRIKGSSTKEIIVEASLDSGVLNYGLSLSGWWHNHSDLEFVSEATPANLKKAVKVLDIG